MGFQSVTHFLSCFPGEPYAAVAKRLGNEFAGLQLVRMQNEEAKSDEAVEALAMDSLARGLNRHLPAGWRHGARGDFDTSGAFADWIVRLKQLSPGLGAKANSVWSALEEFEPVVGWLPHGPDDDLVVRAFSKGWYPGSTTLDNRSDGE
jgi:hypothetical protein